MQLGSRATGALAVAALAGVVVVVVLAAGSGRRSPSLEAGAPAAPATSSLDVAAEVRVSLDPAPSEGRAVEPPPVPQPPPRPVRSCADLSPVPAGTFDERHVTDLAVAGDEVVATVVDRCGDRNLQLWRSPDGEEWAPLEVGGAEGRPLTSATVTAVDRRVAIVGWLTGGNPDTGFPRVAWTTTEQHSWHATDLGELAGGQLHDGDVVAAGGGFAAWTSTAGGTQERLWWSSTGARWTPLAAPPGVVGWRSLAASRSLVAVLGERGREAGDHAVAMTQPGPNPQWQEPAALGEVLRDGWAERLTGYPDGLAVDLDPEFADAGPTVWAQLGDDPDRWMPLADRAGAAADGRSAVVLMGAVAWVGREEVVAAIDVPVEAIDAQPPPRTVLATSSDGGDSWRYQPQAAAGGRLPSIHRLVAGPSGPVAIVAGDEDLATPGANIIGREPLYRVLVVPG